jgi:hypothetical protein
MDIGHKLEERADPRLAQETKSKALEEAIP